jgi:L-amino acid N-acyltransferase YncA
MDVEIGRTSILSDEATALIAALNAELAAIYPEPGATHFRLDPDEVAPGRGAFLVARADGAPVGCGAVRRLDERDAELKRMYVVPSARGQGVGRALLAALIASTEAAGIWTIESGIFPENTASLALHRAAGFRVVGVRQRIGCHLGRPGHPGGWWRDTVLIERRSASAG